MSSKHNRIIAAAAKTELSSLGFKRKGRSRLWLLDHGHWLNIVGFVPSRWSISVTLENAAHWIWSGHGFMNLDYIVRGQHTEFETEEHFSNALGHIAHDAASRSLEIEERFSSFERIAAFAIDKARDDERMAPSWWGYKAGIAAGILGDMNLAERFLQGISDYRVIPHAQRFLAVIEEHNRFVSEVNIAVGEQRAALELEKLEKDAF